MRVILMLLVAIAACLILARVTFAHEKYKRLQVFFYALALVFGVMFVFIAFIGLMQGELGF